MSLQLVWQSSHFSRLEENWLKFSEFFTSDIGNEIQQKLGQIGHEKKMEFWVLIHFFKVQSEVKWALLFKSSLCKVSIGW